MFVHLSLLKYLRCILRPINQHTDSFFFSPYQATKKRKAVTLLPRRAAVSAVQWAAVFGLWVCTSHGIMQWAPLHSALVCQRRKQTVTTNQTSAGRARAKLDDDIQSGTATMDTQQEWDIHETTHYAVSHTLQLRHTDTTCAHKTPHVHNADTRKSEVYWIWILETHANRQYGFQASWGGRGVREEKVCNIKSGIAFISRKCTLWWLFYWRLSNGQPVSETGNTGAVRSVKQLPSWLRTQELGGVASGTSSLLIGLKSLGAGLVPV